MRKQKSVFGVAAVSSLLGRFGRRVMRLLTAKSSLEPIDISCESELELAAQWGNIFAISKYFNVHWHVLHSAALPAFPVYFSVKKVCSCEKVSLSRFLGWQEGDGTGASVCIQTSRTWALANTAPPKPAPVSLQSVRHPG